DPSVITSLAFAGTSPGTLGIATVTSGAVDVAVGPVTSGPSRNGLAVNATVRTGCCANQPSLYVTGMSVICANSMYPVNPTEACAGVHRNGRPSPPPAPCRQASCS